MAAGNLNACWHSDDHCEDPQTSVTSSASVAAAACDEGGGGSGGGSEYICIDLYYEISFDGGETWHPYVESVCDWVYAT